MNALPIHSPLLLSIGIRDRETLGWIQTKAPFFLSMAMQPIIDAKRLQHAEQFARVSRVGRDHLGVVDTADYGHSIRQMAAYDHTGALLRGPHVELEERQGDIANPNHVVRRARRVDPLFTLKTNGTVRENEFEAAERLRDDMEMALTTLPGGTVPSARTPPWNRSGFTEGQSQAMARVRGAIEAVSPIDRMALLWTVAGGSIGGLATLNQLHHQTVTSRLHAALGRLVDHYGLRYPGDPPMSENTTKRKPKTASVAGAAAVRPSELVTAKVIELRPNPRNPNKHPETQIESLMASLRRDGQTRPLLARKANSMLIAGHGVHTAMRRLGWVECQVMMWDCDEKTAHRVMLADEKLSSLSELDPARTRDLLKEIGEGDLLATGFSQEEMAKLFEGADSGDLEVYEIETAAVTDHCWIAARGPLHLQADIIQRMRHALAEFPSVTIEAGTIEDQ
jgi:hypothetical protein